MEYFQVEKINFMLGMMYLLIATVESSLTSTIHKTTLHHDEIAPLHHGNVSAVCVADSSSQVVTVLVVLILSIIVIGVAGGNFLVILAVMLVKRLQTPSNILIVSLAFSDFFVAILVLPFAVIEVFRGFWPFIEAICDMYISFDVLLCTASILNLCAISIDRYLVITKPLQYASKRTPFRMCGMIAAAWITSALISIPPNFGWKAPFEMCKCEYSKDVGYQIYATFCAFYLPLFVMIVLYGRIFKLAREMSKADMRQKVITTVTENKLEGAAFNEMEYKSPDCVSPKIANAVVSAAETVEGTQQYRHSQSLLRSSGDTTSGCSNGRTSRRVDSSEAVGSFSAGSHHSTVRMFRSRRRGSSDLKGKKLRGNSETKVVKTLGVIMGCFCLCWLPFFIVQLLLTVLTALDYKTERLIPDPVMKFLQWLGYVNSFLNPIIYAKYNREFRSPFKQILLCRCRKINERLRSATYVSQYGVPSVPNRRGRSTNRFSGSSGRGVRPLSTTMKQDVTSPPTNRHTSR